MYDRTQIEEAVNRCRDVWDARAGKAMSTDSNDGYPESVYAGRYDDIKQKLIPGPGLSLLDVGCGRGSVMRHLTQHFGHVVGVDISSSNLERLRQDLADAEVYQASAHDLPFADGSFGRVLMYGVLHYMPTWCHAAQVVTELLRVCRAGGIVMIGDNEPVVNTAYDPPIIKQPQNPSASRYGDIELCFTADFFQNTFAHAHQVKITETFGQPGDFDVIIRVGQIEGTSLISA